MAGLALIIGKAGSKGSAKSKDEMDDADAPSPTVNEYARELFRALKDDDEDAFAEAFEGAMECVHEDVEED